MKMDYRQSMKFTYSYYQENEWLFGTSQAAVFAPKLYQLILPYFMSNPEDPTESTVPLFAKVLVILISLTLVTAIVVPNFLRARKRSRATRTLEDLRMIDIRIDQHAIEFQGVIQGLILTNPPMQPAYQAYLLHKEAMMKQTADSSK